MTTTAAPNRARPGRLVRFLVLRLALAVPVLLGALTLAFAALRVVPGDPVQIMLNASGNGADVGPRQEQVLRHQLGLDEPLAEQYGHYVWHAVRGDFGTSFQTGESVLHTLASAAPASLALAGAALGLAVAVAVVVSVADVWTGNRALHAVASAAGVLAVSTPSYWVGFLLVDLLSFRVPVFPAFGNAGLASLVLPAVTLALPGAGILTQVLTDSLLRTLAEPHVETATAKGAGRLRVLVRHTVRNAFIPTLTITGSAIGNLLGGAVVVETVFARQGLGRAAVDAVTAHDYPVVQAFVFFVTLVYVLVTIVVDLLHAVADPRVSITST